MFETLSDKLSSVFRKFSGKAQLNASNIQEGLREVRLALLGADVNIKVVKEFIGRVEEKCLGTDVTKNLNPAQQVIKIVHEELISLLGGDVEGFALKGPKPHVIMMVGLQGSGKTTSTGKLANWLREQKHSPYMVPADIYRPAAIDQLQTLSKQLSMPCYPSTTMMHPVEIAKAAVKAAADANCDVILLDTAGRLHIDTELMQELVSIKEAVNPSAILFVADAMTGQDAVTVAEAFNHALGITGVILTKMDGDARGGAALSIKSVTGKSVQFVGLGEKVTDLEPFHPDRIAGRILGMGDMLTLIEKAQASIDEEEAEALAQKMQKAEFNFDDFRTQLKRMKSLGSIESLLKMIPGMGALQKKMGNMALPEKELSKAEAIINSMTKAERRNPKLLNASRKQRIAKGCGLPTSDINKLIKQFDAMCMMMKKMARNAPDKAAVLPEGGMPAFTPGAGMNPFGGFPGLGMPGSSGSESLSPEEQKKLRAKRKAERQRKKKNR